MTVAEYLAMEDVAEEKHEYFDGEVIAMAGASFPHNQITANVQRETSVWLKGKSCRIYGSDLKVHVKTKSGFVYPDHTIICNGPQFLDGRNDTVINPVVIIEVFSFSTQEVDHGRKFMLYRQIPSLREYILVSSLEPWVEKFTKDANGVWTLSEYQNSSEALEMASINYQIPLEEIYRDVVFLT